MSKNINRAISLTSYLVSLPESPILFFGMIIFGAMFGIFNSYISGEFNLQKGFVDGLLLLSGPAIASSIIIKVMMKKMPFRRILATALAAEFIYGVAYSINIGLLGINTFWADFVLFIGSSIVFVLWYIIARFIFMAKYRSLFFAILQLMIYLMALFAYQQPQNALSWGAKFYISAFVMLGALTFFLFLINAPMKKNLGLKSTDAISYFFSQWLYHNKDMEKAFELVGENAKTIVSMCGFETEDKKIFFITPCIHFGPFGNLGGSEFSYLISREISKKYSAETFVFHGTVTHDLNPVSSNEMSKIIEKIDKMIMEAKYKSAKISLLLGSKNECKSEILKINDYGFVGLSRAPLVTEDINFGLGLSLMYASEKKLNMAMIVDQHNAETGEITSFEPASEVGFGYLSAIENALSEKNIEKALKIGVGYRETKSESVGKAGIKVAVFSTKPEYILILIDSNGVTPEFRETIEKRIKEIGKNESKEYVVGIFTTDTHQTNMVRGVLNPLKEEEEMLVKIEEATLDAIKDMKSAKFFSSREWFDIKVIGAKQSIEVISTVNSTVAMAKILLPLIFIAAAAIAIALATRI